MFQIDDLYNIDNFLKKLIIFNCQIRKIENKNSNNFTFEDVLKYKLLPKVFTKGYKRIENLKYFIIENLKKNTIEEELLMISKIMSFIVINQVFGDGNHRTAYYVLILLSNKKISSLLINDSKYDFNDQLFNDINGFFDNVDILKSEKNIIYNYTFYIKSRKRIDFFDDVAYYLYCLIIKYVDYF